MKGFIDLVNIMNTLFNRVKEFFNITPGVSNQKGLTKAPSQQDCPKMQWLAAKWLLKSLKATLHSTSFP